MEMAQIRYVLAAARTLNFTKAAGECNVSQPALTKAIKTLESELGAPLFHREGKRIFVSEFGRSMLSHFERIVEEAEATRTLADNFRLLNKAPVRLGVMSTIGHVRLARFIAQFEKSYEGVELSVIESNLTELRAKLDAGDLDLIILNPLDGLGDGYNAMKLYVEKYVVVLPPGHHLEAGNAIALKDLSGEPYVDRLSCEMREMVMDVCEDMNVSLYARFRSEREDWVQAMVAAGIGFAFMPEYSIVLPGLSQRQLVEPSVERTICLASVAGRPFSPPVAALVGAARRFAWPG